MKTQREEARDALLCEVSLIKTLTFPETTVLQHNKFKLKVLSVRGRGVGGLLPLLPSFPSDAVLFPLVAHRKRCHYSQPPKELQSVFPGMVVAGTDGTTGIWGTGRRSFAPLAKRTNNA